MNLGFGGLMSNQHILMTSKCALELRVKCHNLDFKKQNKKQYINPVNPPPPRQRGNFTKVFKSNSFCYNLLYTMNLKCKYMFA